MKNLTFFILSLLYFHGLLFSQVSVTRDGSQPDGTAMMDVKSEQLGFLPPRMNKVQRDAIAAPQDGLMVFCTDCNYNNSGALSVFYQGHWRLLQAYCPIPDSPTEGAHTTTATQIIWNWITVPGALGYKWNNVNDYSTATDLLTSTSYTESNLPPGPHTCYVWAYNNCGVSMAAIFTKKIPFMVGQHYGGGIIFYIDGTGEHGIVAYPVDHGVFQWGCGGEYGITIGGTVWDIGAGDANTLRIVNGCQQQNIAARICYDFVEGDYDDWFLPSMGELYLMYQLRNVIGGFVETSSYYSSTEFGYSAAFGIYMTGTAIEPTTFPKWQGKFVRAVRKF